MASVQDGTAAKAMASKRHEGTGRRAARGEWGAPSQRLALRAEADGEREGEDGGHGGPEVQRDAPEGEEVVRREDAQLLSLIHI